MTLTFAFLLAVGLWFVPEDEKWFRLAWFSILSTIALLVFCCMGPLMWRIPQGASYQLTLTDKRLQVESPHEHFGQSADIQLDDIAELRTVMDGTDEHCHEVHCKSGVVLKLNQNAGLRPDLVFERIRELRPDLFHRRGQANELTANA